MTMLRDEVCIVTGSTAGLGIEIARLFAAEGGRTVITGRNQERGDALAHEIEAAGGRCAFIRADLARDEDCESLVEQTKSHFGPATVLVNNAVSPTAIERDGPVAAVDTATWEMMLRVNLIAVATLCRLVIPDMVAAGAGSIVNISSRAAERGTSGLAAYTASKGGLNALARSITVDYARDGVRCNTVQPGYIVHERRDEDSSPERTARFEAMQLTRMTTANDVARAALFFASDASEVISGTTLQVDGGSSATRGLTLG